MRFLTAWLLVAVGVSLTACGTPLDPMYEKLRCHNPAGFCVNPEFR